MKALLFAAAALLLVGPALATLGDNGMTTYTGRKRVNNTLIFGNALVLEQAVDYAAKLAVQGLTGTWKPFKNDPETPKEEIKLSCLNSIAPPPLNWHMWCPGKDAKVVGWIDKSGSSHRQITLRPQKNMTSSMAMWFITTHVLGLMPPVVNFQGNNYYYYHLWHPLDHVESIWSMGPALPVVQPGLPIYCLIHERYRNPSDWKSTRHYETNGWFFVSDAINNLMKNRYVITMPLVGFPTWTMMIEFNDTPEGLVVDIEVVAGIPHKGYDNRNPIDGYTLAAGMNEMFSAPVLAEQKKTEDWEGSINAITRHAIEEFSNLQFFVPTLYERFTPTGKVGINWIPTLGNFMQNTHTTVADSQTVSFYNTLVELAKLQVDKSNTTYARVVDSLVATARNKFYTATDIATLANVAKSQLTYVPASNAVTRMSYEMNKANGARPEMDFTLRGVINAASAAVKSVVQNVQDMSGATVVAGAPTPRPVATVLPAAPAPAPTVAVVAAPAAAVAAVVAPTQAAIKAASGAAQQAVTVKVGSVTAASSSAAGAAGANARPWYAAFWQGAGRRL